MKLNYAYKVVPREGETLCGDAVLAQVTDGRALFAVIDALGHGEEAWRVAERAMAALLQLPHGIDATKALEVLHLALHGTRGAAATLCSVHGAQAELIGFGNVTCRTLGAAMPFVPKPGIVGGGRRVNCATRLTLVSGQRLVLHSDGVSHRFDLRSVSELSPADACAWILSHHRYARDDASVLVIDAKATMESLR